MDNNSFDLNRFQELLNSNKKFFDSFFGSNPFDENFFRRVMNEGNVFENESNLEINNNDDIANNSRKIPIDMIQKKNEIYIVLEIPGLFNKDDLKINVYGSTLVIEGDIRRQYVLTNKERTKLERQVGHFTKRINIPVAYDSKRIRAKYTNGLLHITIPTMRQTDQENISVQFIQTDD